MSILWRRLKAVWLNNQGFTLVELLLVVALVGMVLAIPIQALFLTNRDWQYNQAMSPALMDGNLLFSRLGNEIRSADKPGESSKAVDIISEQLVIFRPAGTQWERIEYRLNGSNQVQRGTFSGQASQVMDRSTNAINNWTTLASNVSELNFTDTTQPGSVPDRRLIQVAVKFEDGSSQPSFQPFSVQSNFLSRSQQSGSAIAMPGGHPGDGTVPDDILVKKVTVTSSLGLKKKGTTGQAIAKIEPSNATNKTVSWSSNKPDVAKVSSVSSDGLTATITAVKNGEAKITVTTESGNKTATCTVTVTGAGNK